MNYWLPGKDWNNWRKESNSVYLSKKELISNLENIIPDDSIIKIDVNLTRPETEIFHISKDGGVSNILNKHSMSGEISIHYKYYATRNFTTKVIENT